MTFVPVAKFDPSELEASVTAIDFTPTGVTVWLRGTADTNDLPAIATNQTAAWLVNESSGQRFLLVAADEPGREALAAFKVAPPGSVTLYGRATRADDKAPVSVQVEGSSSDE